jgi:hypothetical protein
MRLTFWIYFDNHGEKEKLKKIMDEPCDDFEKNRLIQEEFGVDLLTASRVIDTYYKSIKK